MWNNLPFLILCNEYWRLKNDNCICCWNNNDSTSTAAKTTMILLQLNRVDDSTVSVTYIAFWKWYALICLPCSYSEFNISYSVCIILQRRKNRHVLENESGSKGLGLQASEFGSDLVTSCFLVKMFFAQISFWQFAWSNESYAFTTSLRSNNNNNNNNNLQKDTVNLQTAYTVLWCLREFNSYTVLWCLRELNTYTGFTRVKIQCLWS